MMASSNSSVQDHVYPLVRALLLSFKTGILLENFQSEYRNIIGGDIPFMDMGHKTIEEFVKNSPDLCWSSRNNNGKIVVHAVVTESTAHIAKMVSLQKGAGKRSLQSAQSSQRHSHSDRQEQEQQQITSPKFELRGSVPQSYVKELEQYFETRNLTPFKISTVSILSSEKGDNRSFVSAVIVDNESFRTYPNEYPTEEEAMEAASKLALESLRSRLQSISLAANTADIDTVAKRVATIVGTRNNGVWSSEITRNYEGKYNEQLPANWLKLIDKIRHSLRVTNPMNEQFIVFPC